MFSLLILTVLVDLLDDVLQRLLGHPQPHHGQDLLHRVGAHKGLALAEPVEALHQHCNGKGSLYVEKEVPPTFLRLD